MYRTHAETYDENSRQNNGIRQKENASYLISYWITHFTGKMLLVSESVFHQYMYIGLTMELYSSMDCLTNEKALIQRLTTKSST